MEETKMTVGELKVFLDGLRDCDDFVINIGGYYLYRNEIGLSPIEKELTIKGKLYNEDIWEKATKLKEDITKAFNEFAYGEKR